MQTKLQLELLGSLKRARIRSSGFSFMELMIVVAIVGLLSALSLPGYLQGRAAMRAGAVIGQELGLAKECATWVLSGGIGARPPSGPGRVCNLTSPSRYEGSWGEFGPVSRGLRCLQVTNHGGVAITISVSTSGELTCEMGGPRA
jgi:type IV pilus assembly protein PilA